MTGQSFIVNSGTTLTYGGIIANNGGSAVDYLSGGAGDDRLFGDDGDDVIFGDAGNDELVGGNGIDLVFGGEGDDVHGRAPKQAAVLAPARRGGKLGRWAGGSADPDNWQQTWRGLRWRS